MKLIVLLFLLLFNYNVVGQIKVDNVGDGWVDKVNQAITLIKKVDSFLHQLFKIFYHVGTCKILTFADNGKLLVPNRIIPSQI